jgi:hypothetical protein
MEDELNNFNIMQQWEYKVLLVSEGVHFESLGKEGWEFCGIYNVYNVFKRPIGPSWEDRCKAAEAYIDTLTQHKFNTAYNKWQEIKNFFK